MHRLGGEDSGFLSLELPSQPITSHFVAHLRPPKGPDGQVRPIALDDLARHVAVRLGELPAFRWRIVPVPAGFDHHVAIEDPSFVLENHLRRVVARPPGTRQELARISDSLASRRLDRSRPMWELVLVDGLADERQALIIRFHHALMDGAPTLLLLSRLLSGDDHEVVRAATPWEPDAVPSRGRLFRDAVRDRKVTLRRLPHLVRATARGVKAHQALQRESTVVLPKAARDTPPCSLNDAFTARRRHANLTLPMADVMRVKNAAGVTVTKVVLAVTAGGLRRYLMRKNDLPARPLIAGTPVALDRSGLVREWGNNFVNVLTSLATDVEDPWERLERIAVVTDAAQRSMDAFGGELICEWSDQLPPFLTRWLVRRHVRLRKRRRDRADINVNVSVLKGPTVPWSLGPALVDDFFIEGPPNTGCGVCVTALSYVDHMSIGIHTCADAVPDPEVLAADFVSSLDELVAIAADRGER
jgi:diacylglycerol O-acyltransferase